MRDVHASNLQPESIPAARERREASSIKGREVRRLLLRGFRKKARGSIARSTSLFKNSNIFLFFEDF